jgi:hypothetical protein
LEKTLSKRGYEFFRERPFPSGGPTGTWDIFVVPPQGMGPLTAVDSAVIRRPRQGPGKAVDALSGPLVAPALIAPRKALRAL